MRGTGNQLNGRIVIFETLIDYETVNSDSDLLGLDNDTNVADEDGKIERNDVI